MADPGHRLNASFEKYNSVFFSRLVMGRVNCLFPEWNIPFQMFWKSQSCKAKVVNMNCPCTIVSMKRTYGLGEATSTNLGQIWSKSGSKVS